MIVCPYCDTPKDGIDDLCGCDSEAIITLENELNECRKQLDDAQLKAHSFSEMYEAAEIDLSECQRERDRLADALKAASSALMSYQYGNSSPELAESVSEACNKALAALEDDGFPE